MNVQYGNEYAYLDMAALMAFVLGFIVFFLIFALIAYILSAIIFSNTANTNGFNEIAVFSWIPIINIYVLFALISKKTTIPEIKSDALKYTLIYFGLAIVSAIPVLGFLAAIALMVLVIYSFYRLFYRWTGDQTKAILFVILMYITGGIFFYVYGLMKMKDRFMAW
ncbi:hypothetical protein [Ureibacillus acetophenoni]|uniref:Uncharacterized protein n=1 Tax=Ureibacillus acetophenoni TaxID=614649 RepID=A0A285TZD3_9BACL|nr:hypothetical protein [Ureibacillus acetophenoni]SOC34932.1 hypothetical protein SAMN05877842_101169 [Ureibacillus acetophenoni]